MPHFMGKLAVDEEGNLCLKMKISPANPNIYDIPLEELFEDYLDKDVFIEIYRTAPAWEIDFEKVKGGGRNGD